MKSSRYPLNRRPRGPIYRPVDDVVFAEEFLGEYSVYLDTDRNAVIHPIFAATWKSPAGYQCSYPDRSDGFIRSCRPKVKRKRAIRKQSKRNEPAMMHVTEAGKWDPNTVVDVPGNLLDAVVLSTVRGIKHYQETKIIDLPPAPLEEVMANQALMCHCYCKRCCYTWSDIVLENSESGNPLYVCPMCKSIMVEAKTATIILRQHGLKL